MKNGKADSKASFEASLEGLEDIVRQLEAGDKGLEESLALFEKGVGTAKELSARLEAAKKQVEVLTKEGGKLARKPLEEEAA